MTFFFFFFNDTATTEIYTLSLHDALPICTDFPCDRPRDASMKRIIIMGAAGRDFHNFNVSYRDSPDCEVVAFTATQIRSEEHTSELQSQSNLVCRLLLEKKKYNNIQSTHL